MTPPDQPDDFSGASLVESEQRFRSISDCAAVGIWVCDPSGDCIWLNRHWLEFAGAKLEDHVGSGWLEIVHPDDRDTTYQTYSAACSARESFDLDYRLKRSDGEYHWHSATGNPRFGDQQEFLGYVGISVNNHETRLARESERQLREKLQRSNQDLKSFSAIAAHDLKAPLRAISLCGKFLEEDAGEYLKDADKQHLTEMINATSRLSKLVGDLLEYSSLIDKSGLFSPVDTSECLDQSLGYLSASIQATQANIVLPSGPLPTVMGYASLLTRLFQNLIGNAIHYHSSDPPQIKVDFQRQGEQIQFSISDNGIGIAPEFHNKIFEAFKRLHSREQYEGSGIGLATCKRIVEDFGGQIWVESQLGSGSVFHFTLNAASV